MSNLIERLRGAVQKLRRTPMPISDVAPMLTQAADRIADLERQVAEQERLLLEVRRCFKPNEPEQGHLTILNATGEQMCEWCKEVDATLAQAKKI